MLKISRLFIPIIIFASIASYLNSFHNQFIWDDEDFVLKNSTIKDWHKWPHIFTENMIQGARKGSNFYRPMQSLTHGMDYILWKDNPTGHHATNFIFHILAIVAVYLMLKGIFATDITAFLSALFFAVHPVQTEAVTYISGRSDPMAGLFIVLAVILFNRNLFISCVSFVLAILSKESALIAPALIILTEFFRGRRFQIKRILPFIVIAIIYGILRLSVLDFSYTAGENLPKPFFYVPLWIRFCTFLKTIPVYFGILLWPFGLHMERDISLSHSIFEPQAFLGFMILTGSILTGYLIRKKSPAILFSAAWFFIAIFPNSNIIPINALVYEHWLYLPSLGFFIATAWLLKELHKKGKIFGFISILLALSIALFYMWRTFERNKDWKTPVSFYESTIRYMPHSARLHNNLAMAYADSGYLDKAIAEYKKAIILGDYYPQTHYNLANIYIAKGDYESALNELKRSLEIDNNFLYSHESLALIYLKQGRVMDAKKEAEFILSVEPANKIAIEISNQ